MIDPLLRERARPSVEPAGTARRSPRGRGLRVAGAAGMGSLMVVTGYMTGSAGQQAAGSTPTTTAVPATSLAPSAVVPSTVLPVTASTLAPATSITVAPTTTIPCTTTYTVVAGDSWVAIAHRASVVVDILYVLNGSSAETVIHPGDSICIPDGAVVATTTSTTAPATTAAPTTTQAPVVTTPVVAVPAAPAAQPASNSGGS